MGLNTKKCNYIYVFSPLDVFYPGHHLPKWVVIANTTGAGLAPPEDYSKILGLRGLAALTILWFMRGAAEGDGWGCKGWKTLDVDGKEEGGNCQK